MGSKSFTNKVVGIFTDRTVIDSVLNELNSSGFDSGDISVLARDMDENNRIVTHSTTTYPETGYDVRTGNTYSTGLGTAPTNFGTTSKDYSTSDTDTDLD